MVAPSKGSVTSITMEERERNVIEEEEEEFVGIDGSSRFVRFFENANISSRFSTNSRKYSIYSQGFTHSISVKRHPIEREMVAREKAVSIYHRRRKHRRKRRGRICSDDGSSLFDFSKI